MFGSLGPLARRQSARTSDLVFGVPELVARLSRICPLVPGDLIFTGTPSGVWGPSRTPPLYLHGGDGIVTTVEGLGELRNMCTTNRALAGLAP